MSLVALIAEGLPSSLRPYAKEISDIKELVDLHKFRSRIRSLGFTDFMRLQSLADLRAHEIREQLPPSKFALEITCSLSDEQLDELEIGWMLPCGFQRFWDRKERR